MDDSGSARRLPSFRPFRVKAPGRNAFGVLAPHFGVCGFQFARAPRNIEDAQVSVAATTKGLTLPIAFLDVVRELQDAP